MNAQNDPINLGMNVTELLKRAIDFEIMRSMLLQACEIIKIQLMKTRRYVYIYI